MRTADLDDLVFTERQIELLEQGPWYQAVDVDGVATRANPDWANSRFYNRGKWDNFIAPLLPPGRGAFAELGSNAGLYLLYAAEAGYRQVLGVEGDDLKFHQSRLVVSRHRERDPDRYRRIGLLHARVGEPGLGATASCNINPTCEPLDLDQMPPLDIMLLANVLYWIESEACRQFIADLARIARHAIVVSVETPSSAGPASAAEVRAAFAQDWFERSSVPFLDPIGDPAPRRMFSCLFESRHRNDLGVEADPGRRGAR